jgi:energy-coupling factor transporter ATP-binding protein EcfA2
VKARENPFGATRVLSAIRYAAPAGDPDDSRCGAVALLPRLEALAYRAAIVGPHGSGKTTLLEDLERMLAPRGFRIIHVRLDTDERRLPPDWRVSARRLAAGDIVCLDGAEQLGPVAWLRFRWRARRAAGVIITTHQPGRLPTLVACTTSPALLDRIIRRLAPDGLAAAPPAAELFARHRGNLRNALRELYDVYAAAPREAVTWGATSPEGRRIAAPGQGEIPTPARWRFPSVPSSPQRRAIQRSPPPRSRHYPGSGRS